MKLLLVLACLLCAAPAWCDSLTVQGYFDGLDVSAPGCESDSLSLSPVNCSAYYAPGNAFVSGSAQFTESDPYHFELKGTTSVSKDPSSRVVPQMRFFLNLNSTLPAYSGNYIFSNKGALDADLFYSNSSDFLETPALPRGTFLVLYHNNGEQDSLQLDNQFYAGESGNFDILISTTPTPEPATAGLLAISFAAASAFAWRFRG